jgi:hypothetical protein
MVGGKLLWTAASSALLCGALCWSCPAPAQDSAAEHNAVHVTMRDACDPKTFNAALGPGTCVPGQHGTTKLEFFLGELQTDKIAGAWRFDPLLKASTGTFTS